MDEFRLRIARWLCPDTHRIMDFTGIEADANQAVWDLKDGGDSLARGCHCDPKVLFSAAVLIRKLTKEYDTCSNG